MHKSRLQNFSGRLSISLLILQLIFPLHLQAQVDSQTLSLPADDIIAPKVVHESESRGVNPNGTYFFSADVTDDVAVQSVTLFYRTKGDQHYVAIPMTSSKPPSYGALLSPESVKAPGIEYYIQAKDSSGNAVLVGAAFSPLSMAVLVPVNPKALASKQTSSSTDTSPGGDTGTEKKSSNAKWWWIAAGVVVVALVAGGGGGGGGGGDDPAPHPTPPSTGGITITAPLPQ